MIEEARIKKLFTDALEIEPEHRSRFVAEASGSDHEFRRELESLLSSYDDVADFLDRPIAPISAIDVASQILESEQASAIGKLVGPYRIEKEIGHGGMGTVYLGVRDDGTFRKRVAIKLLREGIENEVVLLRFETERQILADLDHPNIARLIDGGITESGLPYFVMDYVEGLPLDQYCEERVISLHERLRIFRDVCAAVQFAHDNSVIHRDIKPSNILVNSKGVPKLLDFGIAKVVRDQRALTPTATALRAMTPEYASPEQIRGEPVGKASDIYSLGVVLYQIVAGKRPYNFERKSMYEIVHAICDEDPIAPSESKRPTEEAVASRLTDLDNIVLKSLSKKPERRYGSVHEFADDVSRYAAGSPVAARPLPIFRRIAGSQIPTTVALFVGGILLLVTIGWALKLWPTPVEDGRATSIESPQSTPVISTNETARTVPSDRENGGSDDPEARELCRRAHDQWDQRHPDAIKRALALYVQATERDPNFAIAYSGISDSYFLLSVWGGLPANDAFTKAREASLKAVSLAPNAAEGHLSLAMVHWLYEYDWQGADVEFQAAIRLKPTYVRAPHWYGLYLGEMGRFDEAIGAEKEALALEPRSLPINADLGRVLYYSRRYPESLDQFRKTMAIDPNKNAPSYTGELMELYEALGMTGEVFALAGGGDMAIPEYRKAYLSGGWDGYLRKLVEVQENGKPVAPMQAFGLAEMHAQLGDNDEVFKYLPLSYEEHDHRMAQLRVDPKFDGVRSDPRFVEWLRRLQLDQ